MNRDKFNELIQYLKKNMPSIILQILIGAFFIILFLYIAIKFELSQTAMIIIFMTFAVLGIFIESAIFEYIANRADVIKMKTWNQYLVEAREYRKNKGYNDFTNMPDFLENSHRSLIIREADTDDFSRMVIRVQNKENKNQCYEIFTSKNNIEQLRATFNIWTILLIYFNENTTYGGLTFWFNEMLNEYCSNESWRIYIKKV